MKYKLWNYNPSPITITVDCHSAHGFKPITFDLPSSCEVELPEKMDKKLLLQFMGSGLKITPQSDE